MDDQNARITILPPPSATVSNLAVIAELEAALALARAGKITNVALCFDDADACGKIVTRWVLGASPNDTAMLIVALEVCRLRILQKHVNY
jgi:hypothetical protein